MIPAPSVPTRFSGRVAISPPPSKPKSADRHHQLVDLEDLGLELLFGAEDMRVVRCRAPHQPAGPRRLVAMHAKPNSASLIGRSR